MRSAHHAAAALAGRVDRLGEALRCVTASAIATCADACARAGASDRPSLFLLHYSGQAPGPSCMAPFGFTMRRFQREAETLPLTAPEHVAALTQVRPAPLCWIYRDMLVLTHGRSRVGGGAGAMGLSAGVRGGGGYACRYLTTTPAWRLRWMTRTASGAWPRVRSAPPVS